MRSKLFLYTVIVLSALEAVLALLSWLFSAAMPDSGVNSLFSGSGIRWFFGHYTGMLNTPVLVWLLLSAVAFGCCRSSGILRLFVFRRKFLFRERMALVGVAFILVLYVAVILLLTVVPNAVLLSATGRLFPSPFSASAVPVAAFGICVLSVAYGLLSGKFRSPDDVCHSLFAGIETAAPLFFLYILLTQLYYSFLFVFTQNPNY